MANKAVVGAQDGNEIFVYMGGDQVVPRNVIRVRIDKSVKIIPQSAFYNRRRLIYVEFHDGIEIVEKHAFNCCTSLRGSIKLLGVKIIGNGAFYNCRDLTDVEFGDKLETIGRSAFSTCNSLRSVTMPSIRIIEEFAFMLCDKLTDLEFGEELETIEESAFKCCDRLRRIAMPLKDDMIGDRVFSFCPNLATVHLVGGFHRTVASLHLESWKNEMNEEINRVNQVLPGTHEQEKTPVVQDWMRSVIHRIDHFKAEHKALLKEATTLLELALWKANLDDNEGGVLEKEGARTTRGRRKRARKEICVTSGASIVIKNVLPFFTLFE
ncbi:leucine-rich repeat domain-containing protein [Skeletonema marinoi]|uniref:Leucine-rich repeat domain-containing protein n=1 Tax=Skeletonema marinoi TaxID=267567 RepID=A0AAD8XV82_9STRA|nr:leucine-rich repeat domain-containing protein [Skeletonema marinoi]